MMPYDKCGPHAYETGSRSDYDETCDGTGARADESCFACLQFLDSHPGDHSCSGSDRRIEQRQTGNSASAANSEPELKPNQPNHKRPAPSTMEGTL